MDFDADKSAEYWNAVLERRPWLLHDCETCTAPKLIPCTEDSGRSRSPHAPRVVAALKAAGCVLEKREDRHGETRTGWWQDGVYLGPTSNPRAALRALMGGA